MYLVYDQKTIEALILADAGQKYDNEHMKICSARLTYNQDLGKISCEIQMCGNLCCNKGYNYIKMNGAIDETNLVESVKEGLVENEKNIGMNMLDYLEDFDTEEPW